MKILAIALKNRKKLPLKHFTETPIFAKLREFMFNTLSKIVYLEKSAAFTGKHVCAEVSFLIELQASSLTAF